MNKLKLTLLVLIACISGTHAQSVVGKWKTISNITENDNGKTKDLLAMQLKMWPCIKDLQTIFEANGKQTVKSPSKCGVMDYNAMPASSWKMNGNTIVITNNSMPTPLGNSATYTVTFKGKQALFTHVYTEEEKKKLHTPHVKSVTITYERIG